MADGTLRLSLDIEPRHAQAAFALFGAPGTPMALAALKVASGEPQPEAPKGGTLAQWVAMRCQESAFQRWLVTSFPFQAAHAVGDTDAKRAASIVRAVCGIESRKELDSDKFAATRLHALIREPYKEQQA